MTERDRLLAYLRQAGLSTPRAEANLDAYRAEILREWAAKFRDAADKNYTQSEPEYMGLQDAADMIDPDASADPQRPDEEPTP